MNHAYLMRSAGKLVQPSQSAAAEFEACRDGLAEELSNRMGAREDLESLIGVGNLSMMQDNSRNFCRFMSAMFYCYEPEVLVQTVSWVFRAYRAHGFNSLYWPANIDTFLDIARQQLTPETFEEIQPFFNWLLVNVPAFVKISDAQLMEPRIDASRHGPSTP